MDKRLASRALVRVGVALLLFTVLPISLARPALAKDHPKKSKDSGPAVHYDTSPELATIAPAPPVPDDGGEEPNDRDEFLPQHPVSDVPDPVVQDSPGTAEVPTPGVGFEGVGQGFSGPQGTFTVDGAPPDTNSAVGATQVVEIVNTSFAVFNKSGTVLYGPVASNTLWTGFGGSCQSTNDGDGIVRYDNLANRWVITQFANVRSANGPYFECVAVSQTNDATGAWNRYAFQYSDFPDYPKLGVWPDAYYITYNNFSGDSFVGAEACAFDRAKMLQGQAATQQCFTTSSTYGGLLPADVDGTTAPPAGANNLMVALGATSTTLASWRFHVDWATPANTTFTGPSTMTVASYSAACGGGTCIPQSGTTNQLDSLADRLMFRLAYRNFADHQSLVVSHAVTAGSGVGVRWYELRLNNGAPSVFQQGTYAPDSAFRWMSSAAMDHNGNIGLGYSLSSSALKPSIRYTGRLATDPAGQMTQGEATLINGGGSQTGGLTRWGDYSSMSVDPTDDCTFWFSSEYLASNGSFNWHTRIGSFTLPGCGGQPSDDFSIAANPTSATVNVGSSATSMISTAVTSGSAQSVSLSASGQPSGATVSFNPSSVTAGNSSTMTVTTTSSTPGGTFPITITGTGTSATRTTSFSLTVNVPPPPGGGITNGGFETGNLSGWTANGPTGVTTSGPHGGTYAAAVGSASTPFSADASIAQTFTAPTGTTTLSVWFKVTCPDTVTYDWGTATLKDNTTGTTTTVLAKTCTNTGTWNQKTAAITAGHNYTLTLIAHDDNYAGDATIVYYDDVVLTAPSPNPVANGNFEAGNLSGWGTVGPTAVTTSGPHSGTYAAAVGSTSTPFSGDASIAQTFTAPTGSSQLSFWYLVVCPDTVTYDWATATLKDNTTGTTTTVLAKTCTNNGTWNQKTATVVAGHSYTLTLIAHDDNYAGDATLVKYDDVAVA